MKMETKTIGIDGMHCGHCSNMIRKSIELVEGVRFVNVTIGNAMVQYDEEVSSIDEIEKAITRFGYRIRN